MIARLSMLKHGLTNHMRNQKRHHGLNPHSTTVAVPNSLPPWWPLKAHRNPARQALPRSPAQRTQIPLKSNSTIDGDVAASAQMALSHPMLTVQNSGRI